MVADIILSFHAASRFTICGDCESQIFTDGRGINLRFHPRNLRFIWSELRNEQLGLNYSKLSVHHAM